MLIRKVLRVMLPRQSPGIAAPGKHQLCERGRRPLAS